MSGAADDHVAVQQLLNRYTDACNRQDWDGVAATFTADGIWAIPGGHRFAGPAQFLPPMQGFVAQMDYWVQLNSAAVIKVDGDRATVRVTIRECGRIKGRDEGLEVLGAYDDAIVREGGEWKFAERRFSGMGSHRFPLSPGPALPL